MTGTPPEAATGRGPVAWLLAPAPAARLATLRILVAGYATVWAVVRLPAHVAHTDQVAARWQPVGVLAPLASPPPDAVVVAVAVLAPALCLLVALGWRHGLTGPAAAAAVLSLATLDSSWGQVFHTENLMVLHLVIIALAPGAADALVARRRGSAAAAAAAGATATAPPPDPALDPPPGNPEPSHDPAVDPPDTTSGTAFGPAPDPATATDLARDPTPDPALHPAPAAPDPSPDAAIDPGTAAGDRYGWPVRLAAVVVVLTYTITGVAKLRLAGLDWLDGDTLRHLVAHDNLRKAVLGDHYSPIGPALVARAWVFAPFALLTLVVELGACTALLGGRWRTAWVTSAWLFHVGVLAIMAVLFAYPLSGVAFAPFFGLERLAAAARARVDRHRADRRRGGRRRLPPRRHRR